MAIETIGTRIRRLRMAKGISQADLAKSAGLHPSSLNQIEKGKRAPGRATIDSLARQLETTRNVIIDGERQETAAAPRQSDQYVERAELSAAIQETTEEILRDLAYAIIETLTTRAETRIRGQIARTGTGTAGRPTRNRDDR